MKSSGQAKVVAATADARSAGSAWRSRFIRNYATLGGLVAICVIFAILRPSVFLTASNVKNILQAVAILAVIAVMQTIVLAVGDFDLSVGNLVSFSSIVVAQGMVLGGFSTPVSIVVALGIGALIGAINGVLVAYLNISAFIATLAVMTALDGGAWLAAKGTTVHGLSSSFVSIGSGFVGPVPIAVIISLAVVILGYIVMEKTTVGRRWYSLGGNREASFLSGISVRKLRFWAFVVSGAGCGLAGILLIGRVASAHPTAGAPYLMNSLAAGFLGMTAFRNGQPNIAGTFVGVLILGVLSNGLDITNVNSYVKNIVIGMVIIAAVLAAALARKKGRG